jgi:hypothetical protein
MGVSVRPYFWHYTVGAKMRLIEESGVLKPAVAFVPAGEIPVVWLSSRQLWGPTANKMVALGTGQLVVLNFRETTSQLGGGFRFGLPVQRLIPWRQLRTAARISAVTQTQLVQSARSQGADPNSWAGALEPVPVAACRIERLVKSSWELLAEPAE